MNPASLSYISRKKGGMQVSGNSTFDERAIFLAAVCEQTYVQFGNPQGSFVIPAGYSVCYTIEAKSVFDEWETFGFILESPEELIIAFRGSSTATDWIANITASQVKYPYVKEAGYTHRGFTGVYSSARTGLLAALRQLPAEKQLYVTGHSLGGALATLCAIDIAANTSHASPHLYTYGSPRVGDPLFAKVYPQYVPVSYRVANPFDIVTHVPPSIYKLPRNGKQYYYTHVRTLSAQAFQNGSVAANHMIGSYFAKLSQLSPSFSQAMCKTNPGFCPPVQSPRDVTQVEKRI